MKIRYISAHQKIKNRSKWHKKFILFPRRLKEAEIQFLTYVARRLRPSFDPNVDTVMLGHYEYKEIQDHITKKLMGKQDED